MKRTGGGFTILETMIVLSVTSIMLVSSVAIFSSQQSKQQYRNATRDVELRVQDVMNDVAVGNYGAVDGFTCTPYAGSGGSPLVSVGVKKSGSNDGCIFVGKAIQFQKNRMAVMSLVGNRQITAPTTRPAATFAETKPVVVSSSVVYFDYQYGVEAYSVSPAGGSLVVFATTPNNTGFVGGNAKNGYVSGTQLIQPLVSGTSGSTLIGLTDTFSEEVVRGVLAVNGLKWSTDNKVGICFQNDASGIVSRQYSGMIISGITTALSVQREGDKVGALCT